MKYLIPFDAHQSATEVAVSDVGQKAASLVSMIAAGAPVPVGAIVTTAGFAAFAEYNQLHTRLSEFNSDVVQNRNDQDAISTLCEQHQRLILNSKMPTQLQYELTQLFSDEVDVSYAVRSSGTKEDLDNSSFAGLYHTSLYVQGISEIEHSIKQCWASLYDPKVVIYCLQKGVELSQLQMAVVIQEMVLSEKSGVAFTLNPITGRDDEIVIEACYGLGEALVSGHITPDQYICDWRSGQLIKSDIHEQQYGLFADQTLKEVVQQDMLERGSLSVLSEQELHVLVDELTKLQSHYGKPIDVEWAFANNNLYFVQARPITSIDFHQQQEEWTTADFKDGGVSSSVCTQFMYSLYKRAWEGSMREYLSATNMRKDLSIESGVELFYGRPYWNLSLVKRAVKSIPGFVEREFDQSVGVEISYEGQGTVTPVNPKSMASGLVILFGIKRFARHSRLNFTSFKTQQKQFLDGLEKKLNGADEQAFLKFYCQLIEHDYYRSEAGYFRHIYITNNLTTLIKDDTRRYLSEFEFVELISGLTDLSHVRLSRDIWDLGRKILSESASANYWADTDKQAINAEFTAGEEQPCFTELKTLLGTHKYRSLRELDISEPCFIEEPLTVIEAIKDSLSMDETHSPHQNEQRQYQQFLKSHQAFLNKLPWYKRAGMRKKLQELREFLWWREEFRDLSTQHYYYLRMFSLKVGKILVDRKLLSQANEVFHFGAYDLVELIKQNLNEEQAKNSIRQNHRYYQGYRHFTPPDDIGSRDSAGEQRAILHDTSNIDSGVQAGLSGIACSSGVVIGTARVISDIEDAARLCKNDILVTRFTDPGWTTKFALISGVVTETGGLLSHAAVISREYGIPAVLAVKNATREIKDGDQIRVDGQSGSVQVVS